MEMITSPPKKPSPSSSVPIEPRDWACLPRELTAAILSKVGSVEILTSAQRVCKAWRGVCKDPSMWRSIAMRSIGNTRGRDYKFEAMCLHAVELGQGGLEDISIECFGTDSLLVDIAVRSSNLRRLRLVCCYSISDNGLRLAIAKLPLLDHLELLYCYFSKRTLGVVGHSCRHMSTLKFSRHETSSIRNDDGDALFIAKTMPALRHLQLFGNRLTDKGLLAILKGCPRLEHLDLRKCFNVKLKGSLKQICSLRIRYFREPNDPADEYEFDAFFQDMLLSNKYHLYGLHDEGARCPQCCPRCGSSA